MAIVMLGGISPLIISMYVCRELVENGTTTPNSFHYDNPRPLYDVPRSRSRGDSTSTMESHVEIRNPAYMTKKGCVLSNLVAKCWW